MLFKQRVTQNPRFFQFRVLEQGPVQLSQITFCFWANMTRATHTPRLTGGDAVITTMSTPGKRTDCSNKRCAHHDQLRAPVGGKGTADATRGAEA